MLYTKPPAIEVYLGDPLASPCDAVIVPVAKGSDGKPVIAETLAGETLKESVARGLFTGEVGEVLQEFYKGKLLLYAGVGKGDSLEGVRRGVAAAVKRADKLSCALLVLSALDKEAAAEALVASSLAAYRLEAFKSTKESRLSKLLIDRQDLDMRIISATIEGTYFARDIANAPPHELPPRRLAEKVKEIFASLPNVEVEIFHYERLLREGFGGIVSVGKGSDEKPVMIAIRYTVTQERPVALVGKAVVFDSGGINLKSGDTIFYMRSDKAGGAAVIGAIYAAARAGLKVNLVALVPAVINVPSGSSYLPSDIIRMYDGTVVEINNTDAEGRLIIGDAIAYAAKAIDAAEIIDLATLTGAIVVALGPLIAGLFTRDERLARALLESSKRTGEKLWQMPMEDDYKPWLTRNVMVGDILNSGGRTGGAIYGALFLERFAHGKPYAHLDIAGPGMAYEASGVAPQYWPDRNLAPGYGVRLLLDYLARRSS